MTTSFKQIIWNYIKQLLLNSWQQRRPFWSQQRGDSCSTLPQRCYEEHTVLLYTNTHCAPHCACCQTLLFQITLYSVRDPGSPNPARQMQNGLVKAALTSAITQTCRTREATQICSRGQRSVDLPHCLWWYWFLKSILPRTLVSLCSREGVWQGKYLLAPYRWICQTSVLAFICSPWWCQTQCEPA